ncbi:MAG TPA: anthrone oxygenase family protein [Spirillospora sp.]
MRTLQSITLMASTVGTGLVAGLLFAYACSVMPGLGRSSDRTFVEAMQNINRAIINPWFLVPFVGSLPLIVLAAVLAWRGHGRSALPWILAALVLYVIAFLITRGVNIPLNDRLDRAGDPARVADPAEIRRNFEGRWVTWHLVRTVAHTAAFACLAWALVVHTPPTESSAAPAPSAPPVTADSP